MDEEFTKIMQNTDPHSQGKNDLLFWIISDGVLSKLPFSSSLLSCSHLEYVDNLKDEGRVCAIIDRLLNYLENKGSTEEICRIYLRRIMHTYYKFDYKAHRRSLGLQGESKVRRLT